MRFQQRKLSKMKVYKQSLFKCTMQFGVRIRVSRCTTKKYSILKITSRYPRCIHFKQNVPLWLFPWYRSQWADIGPDRTSALLYPESQLQNRVQKRTWERCLRKTCIRFGYRLWWTYHAYACRQIKYADNPVVVYEGDHFKASLDQWSKKHRVWSTMPPHINQGYCSIHTHCTHE